jgi:hypothetical protein
MKALTITQPYATLIAIGAKTIETRGWRTDYMGPIAIHAGAGLGPVGGRTGLHSLCASAPFAEALLGAGYSANIMPAWGLPLGAIVAVATLINCRNTSGSRCEWVRDLSDQELAFGDYSPARYGWVLVQVRRLPEPVPCKGALSLWQLPPDVLASVNAQLQEAI